MHLNFIMVDNLKKKLFIYRFNKKYYLYIYNNRIIYFINKVILNNYNIHINLL